MWGTPVLWDDGRAGKMSAEASVPAEVIARGNPG